ncbi:hypothetical protein CMI41_03380 [Candidatus Pacearchaeota archaeon]|nr:hypothetical protein [Candidatus Pacearchaeota archaeon]|tara:strand:+ start:10178 stop:11572 length:1395 start_codon:yes stop_codon:yes gene_type:complete
MEKLKEFTLNFFNKLGANITKKGEVYVVSNIIKSFEDIVGQASPYPITFDKETKGAEYLSHTSIIFRAINKYLENAGKTTLLRIDFEEDLSEKLKKRIKLKNCEIENITKQHKNHFFSRFSFLTTFQYINKKEQILNEIYVHEGKVVEGSLDGYKIVEGENKIENKDFLMKDYDLAKEKLKELTISKTEEISKTLEKHLDKETEGIKKHYDNLLGELGGDLTKQLVKINELELQLRVAEGETEKEELKTKIDRLKKGLLKIADDEAKSRVLKEREFSVNNAKQKNSLNISNKLINTTVIYYPIFQFNLYIKGDNSKRFLELSYDPLTKEMDKLKCECCGTQIEEVQIDEAGHLTCSNCLDHCSECGKVYCGKCLNKSCHACGKPLCKKCSKVCFACGKYACPTHLRKDCVSGEDRCTMCLRACLRCHGLAEEKHFGESMDGSKVCQKCLAQENRNKIMKNIFEN